MNKSGKKKNRNILKGLQLFKTKKKLFALLPRTHTMTEQGVVVRYLKMI